MATTPDSSNRAAPPASAAASAPVREVLGSWPRGELPTPRRNDLAMLSRLGAVAVATELVRGLPTALVNGGRPAAEVLDSCVALVEQLEPEAHPDPGVVARTWRALQEALPDTRLRAVVARALGWMLGRSGDPDVRTALDPSGPTDGVLLRAVERTLSMLTSSAAVARLGPRSADPVEPQEPGPPSEDTDTDGDGYESWEGDVVPPSSDGEQFILSDDPPSGGPPASPSPPGSQPPVPQRTR
jgi:hypothetical protein